MLTSANAHPRTGARRVAGGVIRASGRLPETAHYVKAFGTLGFDEARAAVPAGG